MIEPPNDGNVRTTTVLYYLARSGYTLQLLEVKEHAYPKQIQTSFTKHLQWLKSIRKIHSRNTLCTVCSTVEQR